MLLPLRALACCPLHFHRARFACLPCLYFVRVFKCQEVLTSDMQIIYLHACTSFAVLATFALTYCCRDACLELALLIDLVLCTLLGRGYAMCRAGSSANNGRDHNVCACACAAAASDTPLIRLAPRKVWEHPAKRWRALALVSRARYAIVLRLRGHIFDRQPAAVGIKI